ncbi:MAG: DNA primase [Parcubacteria group bacterium]|nr:DNA primase [Parcubacteria group bacterium]
MKMSYPVVGYVIFDTASMDSVEEIKSKLDIVSFISEYLELKAAGANHKARCPFHHEKSPSFMVSPSRQIWHCFGCGKGGDVFSFLQLYENIDFPEALKFLADKAGVVLQKKSFEDTSEKNTLFEINEKAALFFHELLMKHPKAEHARNYAQSRGLDEKTLRDFCVGYAPDGWEVLRKYFNRKGIGDQNLQKAGLVVPSKQGGAAYDRFRNRLMFPIKDHQGNTVGFTARVLDPEKDKMGKYINTPETAVYHKSRILYGLFEGKKAIRELDTVVLVEGQMDVIASHKVGCKHVVASSGTALTVEQLSLLKRYAKNIAFCFDTDGAGIEALDRAFLLALEHDLHVKVVNIPDGCGKDADECIQKNPDLWKQILSDSKDYMEVFMARLLSQPRDNPVQKQTIIRTFLSLLKHFQSRLMQNQYMRFFAFHMDIPENILYEEMQSLKVKKAPSRKTSEASLGETNHALNLEETVLAFYTHPAIAGEDNVLTEEMFFDESSKKLYRAIKKFYNEPERRDFEAYLQSEDPSLVSRYHIIILFFEKEFFHFQPSELKQEWEKLIAQIQKRYYQHRLMEIKKAIHRSEQPLSHHDKMADLMKDFEDIASKMKSLS